MKYAHYPALKLILNCFTFFFTIYCNELLLEETEMSINIEGLGPEDGPQKVGPMEVGTAAALLQVVALSDQLSSVKTWMEAQQQEALPGAQASSGPLQGILNAFYTVNDNITTFNSSSYPYLSDYIALVKNVIQALIPDQALITAQVPANTLQLVQSELTTLSSEAYGPVSIVEQLSGVLQQLLQIGLQVDPNNFGTKVIPLVAHTLEQTSNLIQGFEGSMGPAAPVFGWIYTIINALGNYPDFADLDTLNNMAQALVNLGRYVNDPNFGPAVTTIFNVLTDLQAPQGTSFSSLLGMLYFLNICQQNNAGQGFDLSNMGTAITSQIQAAITQLKGLNVPFFQGMISELTTLSTTNDLVSYLAPYVVSYKDPVTGNMIAYLKPDYQSLLVNQYNFSQDAVATAYSDIWEPIANEPSRIVLDSNGYFLSLELSIQASLQGLMQELVSRVP